MNQLPPASATGSYAVTIGTTTLINLTIVEGAPLGGSANEITGTGQLIATEPGRTRGTGSLAPTRGASGAIATMLLQQSGNGVNGIVTWDAYECSDGAYLQGTLHQDELVALMISTDGTQADFTFDVHWDILGETIQGPWQITKPAVQSLCGIGVTGDMDLGKVGTGTSAAAAAGGGASVFYWELQADGTTRQVTVRAR